MFRVLTPWREDVAILDEAGLMARPAPWPEPQLESAGFPLDDRRDVVAMPFLASAGELLAMGRTRDDPDA